MRTSEAIRRRIVTCLRVASATHRNCDAFEIGSAKAGDNLKAGTTTLHIVS